MEMKAEKVYQTYLDRYGQQPKWIVRAPGRVNLIGEHTDYNDGYVLPMAIDRAIWIALEPSQSGQVKLYSADYESERVFNLEEFSPGSEGWIEYVKGIAWVLKETGIKLTGWQGVVTGDIPIGAGLSSSAAMELAAARAFAAASGIKWDPVQMALAGQRAENEWVGVSCGIMDQLISAVGAAGHALLIDCRSLETRPVRVPPGSEVVVMDTKTRRGLVDSAYNERRSQCEEAAQLLGVSKLRDASLEDLEMKRDEVSPIVFKRARHVLTENDRVLSAARAMDDGDARKLGQLMNASHLSLRDDFEVSSSELDIMVSASQEQTECFGARMTGAGFGGCAVALVAQEFSHQFMSTMRELYLGRTGLEPNLYLCRASRGVELISTDVQ